jgi:hypothetical protein
MSHIPTKKSSNKDRIDEVMQLYQKPIYIFIGGKEHRVWVCK